MKYWGDTDLEWKILDRAPNGAVVGYFTWPVRQRLSGFLREAVKQAVSITLRVLELLGLVLFVLFLYSCLFNWSGFLDLIVIGKGGF